MSAPKRLREEVRPGTGREASLGCGLEACRRGEVPVSRRSVGTSLRGFDWGFAGSRVYLLRHAVNTSMWAHPKHPCFVRSKEVHPTPGELCESGRRKFDWLPILTFWPRPPSLPVSGGPGQFLDRFPVSPSLTLSYALENQLQPGL